MPRKSRSPDELRACACFRLRKLARRVTQMYDHALAPAGLTSSQFALLACVLGTPDMSIGELADELVMDPTTLTRTLRPLERQKLIRLAFDANDRRRRVVVPTVAGRAALRASLKMWSDVQQKVRRQLGRSEFETLVGSLDRSLDRLTSQSRI